MSFVLALVLLTSAATPQLKPAWTLSLNDAGTRGDQPLVAGWSPTAWPSPVPQPFA